MHASGKGGGEGGNVQMRWETQERSEGKWGRGTMDRAAGREIGYMLLTLDDKTGTNRVLGGGGLSDRGTEIGGGSEVVAVTHFESRSGDWVVGGGEER